MLPTMTELAAAMVARQEMPPEKGELGPIGPNGKAGLDGENGRNGDPGRQGDRGDRGQDGVAGVDGRNGADGKDGVNGEPGLIWRGPWVRNLQYWADDAVEQDGSSYVCTLATRSKPPSGAWDLLAKRGATGPPGMSRGGGGGGGGSSLTVKDEGVTLDTAVGSIDFVGDGVTTTAAGHSLTVTIPGGGGSQDLEAVLTVGNDADGQDVIGLAGLTSRTGGAGESGTTLALRGGDGGAGSTNGASITLRPGEGADGVGTTETYAADGTLVARFGTNIVFTAPVSLIDLSMDGVITRYGGIFPADGEQLIGDTASGSFVRRNLAGWEWNGIDAWVALQIGVIQLRSNAEDLIQTSGEGLTSTPGHPVQIVSGTGEDADEAGQPLKLDGGRGRGSGVGGDVILSTARAGASNVITGEVLVAGTTLADVEIAGTLATFPIEPTGGFVVTDSSGTPQQVFGQLDGSITGDVGSGGTNTIDYVTGVYSFSFAANSTGPVTADYVNLRVNPLVETLRVRASDGFLLLHGSPFERAAFVEPTTATPEAIALSLIAAGIMAAA